MGRGHLLDVGGDDPHAVTRRVEAPDAGLFRLGGARVAVGRSPAPMASTPVLRIIAMRFGSFSVQTHDRRSPTCSRDAGGVVGEACRRVRRAPAAPTGHPARDGEVVVRHHRRDALLQAALDHPFVVVERGARIEARLGLDARPLEGEAVGVQPELGQRGDVLGVAVVVVAGVARRLVEGRVRGPLHRPHVRVDVAPFDLVAGRRRAPEEAVWETGHGEPLCMSAVLRPCAGGAIGVWHVGSPSAKLCIGGMRLVWRPVE